MDIKHRMIVFDAANIDAESAFWAAFLGGTVEGWGDRWRAIWIDGEWQLGVQSSPNHVPPEWPDGAPQQMHLDFYFVGIEAHDAAHEQVISLGGRLLTPISAQLVRGKVGLCGVRRSGVVLRAG
jgi:hypothetical protein